MPNKIRIAINGFGRIGRSAFKNALENSRLEVVAINDLTDNKTLAHLLKYDSVYGICNNKIDFNNQNLIIDNKKYPVYEIPDPTKLPWKKLKVDVVLECTGRFVKDGVAKAHLKAGAKKVIISAPAKGKGKVPTYLIGVNADKYQGEDLISMGSCTTNCVGPVTRVIEENFGIKKAIMSTIHAYTADQNLVDGPHKDLRRARAAAHNLVPTTTGAAIAVTEILPKLKEKFDGLALRVPVICGSISDITYLVRQKTTAGKVNQAFKRAAKKKELKEILAVSNEPLVSSDIIGTSNSAVVDLKSTKVIGNDLVKVLAWYDNEWAYARRLVEMTELIIK